MLTWTSHTTSVYTYTETDSTKCTLRLCRRHEKQPVSYKTGCLAGAEGLFLLARRSSVRAALTAHRAVIHSRPILALSPPNGHKKRSDFSDLPCWLTRPTMLVGSIGLEPTTSTTSTQESYNIFITCSLRLGGGFKAHFIQYPFQGIPFDAFCKALLTAPRQIQRGAPYRRTDAQSYVSYQLVCPARRSQVSLISAYIEDRCGSLRHWEV